MKLTDDVVTFLVWLEQPKQIILFSIFFILLCVIITKLSSRRKNRHKEFRVRDSGKGHHWVHSDFLSKPTFCNICEFSLVRGVFCDVCWISVHDECEVDGNKKLACKVTSLSKSKMFMRHHWIKGNLTLCSVCSVCNQSCGVEPRLCDYRCIWCHKTVHEGQCYAKMDVECTFGAIQEIILPPYCVTLKTNGWRGHKSCVIKEVRKPNFKKWRPILVFVNPKSGNNEGYKLLRAFRGMLNPAQVIDLLETTAESGLEFCRLLPDIQCRILVCGGDGTVGWILNTIDKIDLPLKPQVGIHPMGTGNDLARVMGWGMKYVGDEHEIEELLKDIEEAKVVQFDRWQVSIKNSGYFGKKLKTKVVYMNSYVSVGCDAQVTLNFHRHRQYQPFLFTSRIINKLMYFIYGSRDVLEAECKNLHKRIELELDGVKIDLPQLEGVVVLNINSWCGGCRIWDSSDNANTEMPSQFNDGFLEVAGLYSSLHIAKLQVNLSSPVKLGRAKHVKITIHKTKEARNVPMQLDGEPWEQAPCVIDVVYHSQAVMLQKVI
uniref:Diacylglycerol kinase n=1 Tax=Hydra vulgaris TaxID=6087 RepID=T2MFN4_HYDVU